MRCASPRKQCFASNHNQGFAKQGNQELRPARSCQRNHEKTTTSRKNYEWSAFGKAVAPLPNPPPAGNLFPGAGEGI
jgi:hypothetical protein